MCHQDLLLLNWLRPESLITSYDIVNKSILCEVICLKVQIQIVAAYNLMMLQ